MIKGCPEPEWLLNTALRGPTAVQDVAILRHVETCDSCRQRVRDIRALGAGLHSIPPSPPSRDCLEMDAIVAVAEGSRSNIDEAAVMHVARCSHCRMRVATAAQLLADATIRSEINALEPGRRAGRPRWSRRNLTVSGLVAAAAAVIVVLGPMRSDVRNDQRGVSAEPQRERGTVAAALRILSPAQIVGLSDSLRWTSLPQADLYRVRIWNSEGTVVWTADTQSTTVPIPAVLESAVPYLWEVSARTGWDRWVSSDLVELTLPPRRQR